MTGRLQIVLFLIVLPVCLANAQVTPEILWTQTFGGPSNDGCTSVESVVFTMDGGYIIGGWTRSDGADYEDVYLVKVSEAGNMVWEQSFGGAFAERCNSLDENSDGSIILAGFTSSVGSGGEDMYLVKTDQYGAVEWEATFGGSENEQCYSVQQTTDGGYILGGSTVSYGAGGYDMYLVKTDASGVMEWDQTYGGSMTDVCYSLDLTSDGGYILGGYTTSYGAGWTDMYVVKVDADGNLEWDRTYGGVSSEHCYSVKEVWWDYGYVLAGETMSYGAGVTDMYVIRTWASGDTVWARTFGGIYNDVCKSVDVTTDGGFICGGWTTSFGAGSSDFYLAKIDHSCDLEWDMTFGGTEFDQCYAVCQTPDDGFFLGGVTESYGAGEQDIYVVRLGPEPSDISGTVTPHFDGIRIYLMNDAGELVAEDSVLTGDGSFSFTQLMPGEYLVQIIEPLGFEVDQNDVAISLPGGFSASVDFILTPTVTFNDARTKPYWRYEIFSNYYGVGTPDYTSEELLQFFQEIYDHFYANPVHPIQLEGTTYWGPTLAPPANMEELREMLVATEYPNDMYSTACRQLTVLMLNVVSEKVGQYFPASDDGAYICQAIVYIHELLGVDDALAAQIANVLNAGRKVEAGVIPLTTPMVIFSGEAETISMSPAKFSFSSPVPNPFNPSTVLSYTMSAAADVNITVYDVSGRVVTDLVKGWNDEGTHQVTFNASHLPSGVYFARLSAGNFEGTQKLLLVK